MCITMQRTQHNTSEHRATRACGVFTASPGAPTHQPCKPLDLPCHSVHSELHDKSRQAFAHYAHSGRVLACGVARVSLYTLNSLIQDSALTAGSTSKVKDAGERLGDSPTNPPNNLAPADRIAAAGDPTRTLIIVPLGPTQGHPANPSSKLQTGNCPPLGKPQPSALLASDWGHPACQLSTKRATAQPPGTPHKRAHLTPNGRHPASHPSNHPGNCLAQGKPRQLVTEARTPRVPTRHHRPLAENVTAIVPLPGTPRPLFFLTQLIVCRVTDPTLTHHHLPSLTPTTVDIFCIDSPLGSPPSHIETTDDHTMLCHLS